MMSEKILQKVISFDCGLSYVGAAIFDCTTKALVDCHYIDTGIDGRYGAEQVADLVLKVLKVFEKDLSNALITVEYPEQYAQTPAPRSSVQGLACTGGGIVCMLKREDNKVEFVLPKEWKKQVPKDIMLERIVNRLSDSEKAILESKRLIKSKKHNVVDAIGLGLYKIGRL